MTNYDGSIRINTELLTNEFNKNLSAMGKSLTGSIKHMESGIASLKNSVSGLLGSLGLSLGVAGLVTLGKQAIDTASDLQEVQNVVDTAFGDMSYKMEEFAKTSIKQFGLSQLSAKQTGSVFMAMGTSMLDSMEQASDMAISLTGRVGDMASFYNKSVSEVSTAAKSIYTGETESLKEYGVVMTEVNLQEYAATQGIYKKISAMTQAEKVQLRYNYFMEQTALAAGDFAKTSGSWANQTRILSEQFKQLLSILGSGLIAVLTPVVKFLNTMLTQLIAIATQIGAILSKLLGISVPVASSAKGVSDVAASTAEVGENLGAATENANDLKDGVKAAGKAAKGSLAAFDKLNVLSQDKGSGSSGGAGGGANAGAGGGAGGFQIPTVDTKNTEESTGAVGKLSEALQGIADRLKELAGISFAGFLKGLGDWQTRIKSLKTSISSIGKNLKEIFTDPELLKSVNQWVDSVAQLLGTFAGTMASIGLTIVTNLVGGISKYLEQNKETIKKSLTDMFNISTEVNKQLSDFLESFGYVFEAFASEDGQQVTANIIGMFTNAFLGITTLASKLGRDLITVITQPFIDNKDGFKTALEGFLGVLSTVTGTLKTSLDETFGKINEVYDKHFKPFFDSIAKGISKITGKFLDFWNKNVQPMLDRMSKKFDKVYKDHIQPFIDNAIGLFGDLADLLKAIWENTLQPLVSWIIQNILPKILPVIETLWNGIVDLVSNIVDAASGIIDAIRGIITFLTGVFTGDWKKAWEGIKQFFSGIWTSIKSLAKAGITAVKTVIDAGIKLIKGAWSAAWSAIKTIASNAWSGIKSVFSGIGGWFKGKFEGAVKHIKGAFTGIGEFFSGVWSNIKGAFGNIAEWFKTKFSKAWKAVKDVFSTGGKIFTGIKDGILNGLKAVINALISGINKVIKIPFDGLNSALQKIKSIKIAGKKIFDFIPTISVPQIPALANGAVIRGGDPFMAVLGDQPKGQTNIETPLPTMVKAFKQAIAESGGTGGDVSVRVYLGEKDITKAVKTEADMYFKKTGRPLFGY